MAMLAFTAALAFIAVIALMAALVALQRLNKLSEAKTTHYIVLVLLSLTLVCPFPLAIISWLAAAAVVPGLGKLTKEIKCK